MSSKNIFLKFFQGNQPKGASGRRVVGERGSNDLPPGKKGGETMTPDRHYEHKQHAFDSFCKKVLKCEAYNGYREISRRQSREVAFSELPEDSMEQLASYDRYPWEYTSFPVGGEPDAVNTVIRHYSGYIAALSTRTSYDVHGCPYSYVDEELRRRLETKLIIAILDFDLN